MRSDANFAVPVLMSSLAIASPESLKPSRHGKQIQHPALWDLEHQRFHANFPAKSGLRLATVSASNSLLLLALALVPSNYMH